MHVYQDIYKSWYQFLKDRVQEYHISRGKTDDYINELYLNGSLHNEISSCAEKPTYCIDINESSGSLPNWGFFWVVVLISERWKYLKKGVKMIIK